MAEYGRIYKKLWLKMRDQHLSDDVKLLITYIFSGPHTNMLGIYRLPLTYIAEDLDWDQDKVSKAFAIGLQIGYFEYDEKAKLVFIPSWFEYNGGLNGKQLIKAKFELSEIPQSAILQRYQSYLIGLPEPYAKSLAKDIPPITITTTITRRESTSTNLDDPKSAAQSDFEEIDYVLKAIRFMASQSAVFEIELSQNGDLRKKIMDWTDKCSGLKWIMFCAGRMWQKVKPLADGLSDPFVSMTPRIDKPLGYLYSLVFAREFDRQPTFDIGEEVFDDRRPVRWWFRTFFKELEERLD
jgi:hypothetical protein